MTLRDQQLLSLAGVSAFAALILTALVAWQVPPIEGDLTVIRAAQQLSLVFRYEHWINLLGMLQVQAAVVVVAVAAAVVSARRWPGIAGGQHQVAVWALLFALALRSLALPLKLLIEGARPSTAYGLRVTADFPGYGFPSGHVYSDVLIFGVVAVFATALFGRHLGLAVRVLCVALILLAGPARMVVGAHWPSDVLGGYLWGATFLCLAVLAARRLAPRPLPGLLGGRSPLP